jgi:predicted transcriptional regulator
MSETSIEEKLIKETQNPLELTEDDLKCLLVLMHCHISSTVTQVETENNLTESFNKHLNKLMYRLITNEKTNSKEIANVYEKLSREYLKRIVK